MELLETSKNCSITKKKNKALPQLSVEAPYGMKLFETKQQVLKN
jgi:hypothetical protein